MITISTSVVRVSHIILIGRALFLLLLFDAYKFTLYACVSVYAQVRECVSIKSVPARSDFRRLEARARSRSRLRLIDKFIRVRAPVIDNKKKAKTTSNNVPIYRRTITIERRRGFITQHFSVLMIGLRIGDNATRWHTFGRRKC